MNTDTDSSNASSAEITKNTLMSAIIDDDPSIFFKLGQVNPDLDGLTDPLAIGMLRHVTVCELAKVLRMATDDLISSLAALAGSTDTGSTDKEN